MVPLQHLCSESQPKYCSDPAMFLNHASALPSSTHGIKDSFLAVLDSLTEIR